MAMKARGKKPAEKLAAASTGSAPAATGSGQAIAKVTLSVKRRLDNGDELFVAPGIEISCPESELDAKQKQVEERVNTWLGDLLAKFPEAEEEMEEEEGEAEEEGEEEEGEEITEDDIASMKAAELKQLIKDEELDVDPKGMKLAELREAVADALFGEETEEEEEPEEEEEGEEEEGFTEEDLQEMKLGELQEIAEKWEIGAPKMPKGAKLAAKKKAYIEHILENQEEVEEE